MGGEAEHWLDGGRGYLRLLVVVDGGCCTGLLPCWRTVRGHRGDQGGLQ